MSHRKLYQRIAPFWGAYYRLFHTTASKHCGLLSYVYIGSSQKDRLYDSDRQSLSKGLQLLRHRGPDDKPHLWINQDKSVGLGHTRLAIIDLTENGRQPLHSSDQLLHLSMNGELYDHDRIRRHAIQHDHYEFVSHSDSEIAMYLYHRYGLEFPKHLRGEFAITMYDERKKIFMAVRDRFGIKPLYYTHHDDKLIFASEIKALFGFGVPAVWNEEVIYNGGYSRGLQTIYKDIQQVPPGYLLIATENGSIHLSKYYDVSYVKREEELKDKRTEEEMIEGVREQLIEAIRLRMRADVKVGVYLSGGLDSSTVLGMASMMTNKPIDTYSIAFKDHGDFDEQHLCVNTNRYRGETKVHPHILELTHNELADHINDCIYFYEHPIRQTSPIGKFLLSKIVKDNKGKVVLTGEGSDEIFSGYSFFRQEYLLHDIQRDLVLWQSLTDKQREHISQSLSGKMFGGTHIIENENEERDCISSIGYVPVVPFLISPEPLAIASRRLKEKYEHFPRIAFYYNQSTHYDFNIRQQMLKNEISRVHSTQYLTIKGFLLNYLLTVWGDRSEMAHSVEGRTPFLDHHLVDYVNHLPMKTKLKVVNGNIIEKFILREVARPYITDEIYKREKHPFLAPPTFLDPQSKIHQYMYDTLNSHTLKDLDFLFDVKEIQNSFNTLHRNHEHLYKDKSWRELVALESHYLMICGFITLKSFFNVQPDR